MRVKGPGLLGKALRLSGEIKLNMGACKSASQVIGMRVGIGMQYTRWGRDGCRNKNRIAGGIGTNAGKSNRNYGDRVIVELSLNIVCAGPGGGAGAGIAHQVPDHRRALRWVANWAGGCLVVRLLPRKEGT